ncbi:MAG: hypothetical protein ACP5I4_05920 [Oceanipulchritudo sp.]
MYSAQLPIIPRGGRDLPAGYSRLTNGLFNKGTAFKEAGCEALVLRGFEREYHPHV